MLSHRDELLPGYEDVEGLSISVLAPVPDLLDGKPALRWFTDVGKTNREYRVGESLHRVQEGLL